MDQFWITLLCIMAGAMGYLIATFWVRPILRYREMKSQVASDLVFFANAIELQKLDGSFREDTLLRKDANRRCAADPQGDLLRVAALVSLMAYAA